MSKLDTLAGLAVKYNISVRAPRPARAARPRTAGLGRGTNVACAPQVSDIKRSNGLLSDTAMFAKDTLLIPTRAMPPIGCAVLRQAPREQCPGCFA